MEGVGVGEISIPIVEALPDRTSEIHLMAMHPLHGCWARWIDKKEKKKVNG